MKADHPRRDPPTDSREFTAYAELLSMAHDEGLKSIATQLLITPNEENGRLAIVKAVVEVEKGRFEALGDADPGNVEDFLAPHLIRVAETRAKARALRDAVNCGIVSLEELDDVRPEGPGQDPGSGAASAAPRSVRNGGNGQSRSRGNGHPPPSAAPSHGSGAKMTEPQRRYLFRLMAGQGYHKEGAEERLKDIFLVDSLSEVKKHHAAQVIDELLKKASPPAGERSAPANV